MSTTRALSDAGPVLLVGAGKMGMAMARGWLAAGLAPNALTLVDPQPAAPVQAFARESGVALSARLPDAAPAVLVVAVKPQIITDVLRASAPLCGPQTLLVSIAAGVPLATLQAATKTRKLVRAMPNTPAQIGKGITGAIAAPDVDAADRAVATGLLRAAGHVEWLEDEHLLDAVTAVSGSGPAYVFHLVEALARAGTAQGLSADQAMVFARHMVIGAAALMEADADINAATLRENVTSPGGTTAAGLSVLMDESNGLAPLMARTVSAARARSAELGT